MKGPGIPAEVQAAGLEQGRQIEQCRCLWSPTGPTASGCDHGVGKIPIVPGGTRRHDRGNALSCQRSRDFRVALDGPALVSGGITGARVDRDRQGARAQGLGGLLYPFGAQDQGPGQRRLRDAQVANQRLVALKAALPRGRQMRALRRKPICSFPGKGLGVGDPATGPGKPCQRAALQDRVEIHHQIESLCAKRPEPATAGRPQTVWPAAAQGSPQFWAREDQNLV